jgi:hypothetical protein
LDMFDEHAIRDFIAEPGSGGDHEH